MRKLGLISVLMLAVGFVLLPGFWFNGGSKCVGAETLSEILGKAADIECIIYEIVWTDPDMEPTNIKTWSKGNKERTELTVDGITQIQLTDMDAKTMYMYFPEENFAMKMTFPDQDLPAGDTEDISDFDTEIIGTETIDGKECLVVIFIENIPNGILIKTWIWKEYGLIIRQEVTSSGYTSIIEWKNIEFVCAPDSMFELPAGVEIFETPEW